MYPAAYNLYPEIEVFNKNSLKVSDLHEIYYEECGSPDGMPVIFLHGGPGSGCNPAQRRFFDPQYYRIILLDQRGCGRSTPLGEVRENTTDHLVADIETLRNHLGIARWHVFGGSWGSTLGLAYAIKHESCVISLVLRGVFLSRESELNWFLGDVQGFYPEVWQKLISYLPENARDDVLNAYSTRIFSEDAQVNVPAAIQWNAFESSIMRLKPLETSASAPKASEELQKEQQIEVARARIQIHYIQHQCFIDGDAILKSATMLDKIPTVIVQGRYDMVCPPQTAWILACRMPHAEFVMVPDAGHSAMEPGITSALVAATEKFKGLK
jgi:proline iminopeptidase